MYLIAIAWLYVALMMAVAEATSTQGSVLGAIFTFLLYGVLPMAVLMYILGTPARRRARLAQERAAEAAAPQPAIDPAAVPSVIPDPAAVVTQPDGSSHAAGRPVTSERVEP